MALLDDDNRPSPLFRVRAALKEPCVQSTEINRLFSIFCCCDLLLILDLTRHNCRRPAHTQFEVQRVELNFVSL